MYVLFVTHHATRMMMCMMCREHCNGQLHCNEQLAYTTESTEVHDQLTIVAAVVFAAAAAAAAETAMNPNCT